MVDVIDAKKEKQKRKKEIEKLNFRRIGNKGLGKTPLGIKALNKFENTIFFKVSCA